MLKLKRTIAILALLACICVPAPADINIKLTPDWQNIPEYTVDFMRERLGKLADTTVLCNLKEETDLTITLVEDPSLIDDLGEEGYRIHAYGTKVTIESATGVGVMYGCSRFIEWVMENTTEGLVHKGHVDIDFPVKRGQAKDFLLYMPKTVIEEQPFYSVRAVELANLELGVSDLIETDVPMEKYNNYSKINEPYKLAGMTWKKWCDWMARHRMNIVTNWPYSSGTNWWDLAVNPDTAGMSKYSTEDITKAAEKREELLAYARSRGVRPLLMNYVPGAVQRAVKQTHPDIVGTKRIEHHPDSYLLSNPKTSDLFISQIKAITRTYPSLGGFHFRWWGESFPSLEDSKSGKYRELSAGLINSMMRASREVNPDLDLIFSGFYQSGGNAEIAATLLPDVIIQSKWATDWEPYYDPAVPYDKITSVKQPYIISQGLPSEEFHSIGSAQYDTLAEGIKKYAKDAEEVPNLVGFSTVTGEKDHKWVTGTNYIALSHLDWAPLDSDMEKLMVNYYALHYGKDAAQPVYDAFKIKQDVYAEYVVDFAKITKYSNCLRTHGMFGLTEAELSTIGTLKRGLAQVTRHYKDMQKALALINSVSDTVKPEGKQHFRDMLIGMQWFTEFFSSRMLMAEAMIAKKSGDIDEMTELMRQLRIKNRQLQFISASKPNISDDFEMEGMNYAVNMYYGTIGENEQIDHILAPENLAKLRTTKELWAEPDYLEVYDKIGVVKEAVFNVPMGLDIESAVMYASIHDLDGQKPGDEGIMRFAGVEQKLAPTGDGQEREYKIDVPIDALSDKMVAQFELTDRPEGTRGYEVRGLRLVLHLKQ